IDPTDDGSKKTRMEVDDHRACRPDELDAGVGHPDTAGWRRGLASVSPLTDRLDCGVERGSLDEQIEITGRTKGRARQHRRSERTPLEHDRTDPARVEDRKHAGD